MGLKNSYECHDLDKVIFNYSSYTPSDLEKRFLAKCLNYALPLIKLNYGDYMTPFELFYLKIRKLPIEDHELENVWTEIKNRAYSSFDNCNFFWNDLPISKEEYLVLRGCTAPLVMHLQNQKKSIIKLRKKKIRGVVTGW